MLFQNAVSNVYMFLTTFGHESESGVHQTVILIANLRKWSTHPLPPPSPQPLAKWTLLWFLPLRSVKLNTWTHRPKPSSLPPPPPCNGKAVRVWEASWYVFAKHWAHSSHLLFFIIIEVINSLGFITGYQSKICLLFIDICVSIIRVQKIKFIPVSTMQRLIECRYSLRANSY